MSDPFAIYSNHVVNAPQKPKPSKQHMDSMTKALTDPGGFFLLAYSELCTA